MSESPTTNPETPAVPLSSEPSSALERTTAALEVSSANQSTSQKGDKDPLPAAAAPPIAVEGQHVNANIKSTKKKNLREEDPLWEPDLLTYLKTWFRNKNGVRGSSAIVSKASRARLPQAAPHCKPNRKQIFMSVQGNSYNNTIWDTYEEWKLTVTKAEIEKTPLIRSRVERTKADLKTAMSELWEKIKKAWEKAPGAKSVTMEVKLDSNEERDLDNDAKEEALCVTRVTQLEDNINLLEWLYGKLPTQLLKQTGMLCIMTFVRPHPSHGGRLQTFSFHSSLSKDPCTFANTYPEYKENISKPLIEFARSVFSKDACDAIALTTPQGSRNALAEASEPNAWAKARHSSSKRRHRADHSSSDSSGNEGDLDPKLKRILNGDGSPTKKSTHKTVSELMKKKCKSDAARVTVQSAPSHTLSVNKTICNIPEPDPTPASTAPRQNASPPDATSGTPSQPSNGRPLPNLIAAAENGVSKCSSPSASDNKDSSPAERAFVLEIAWKLCDLINTDTMTE
ncbi:unnamed protein product [Peniophora sp. CBMAI 1063]|nr:unnamed protein product [Peniophora sp. CBMAI 1063]